MTSSEGWEWKMNGNGKATALTVDHFAELITASWRKAVTSIIETGRLLIQAKAKLDHGEFLRMFSNRLVQGSVPFGPRTAEMLMTIARNELI